jgi:hypothetical protein
MRCLLSNVKKYKYFSFKRRSSKFQFSLQTNMLRTLLPFVAHLNVSRRILYIFVMDKQITKECHLCVLCLE